MKNDTNPSIAHEPGATDAPDRRPRTRFVWPTSPMAREAVNDAPDRRPNMRCAVAFEAAPGAVFVLDAAQTIAAVCEASVSQDNRRAWAQGYHVAYALAGDVLERFGLLVDRESPHVFVVSDDPGPIPADVAWTLLATMRGE